MVRRDPLPVDILEKLPAATRTLEAAHEVVFSYLFGGLARGAPRPLFDVDIAVYLRDSAGSSRAGSFSWTRSRFSATASNPPS